MNGTDYDFSVLAPATINGMVFIRANRRTASISPAIRSWPVSRFSCSIHRIKSSARRSRIRTASMNSPAWCPARTPCTKYTPSGYFEFGDSLGSAGGTLQGLDTITNIPLASGALHRSTTSACRAGLIVESYSSASNANCTYQSGDTVLAGVTIQLLNSQNQVIGVDRHRSARHVRLHWPVPGTYTVHEVQPAGLHGIGDSVGSAGEPCRVSTR